MSIGRTVGGIVLFMAVIFGMRWGANALLQKVISDVKNPKDNWGKDGNPWATKPIAGLDVKIEHFDAQKFNQGMLYQPKK